MNGITKFLGLVGTLGTALYKAIKMAKIKSRRDDIRNNPRDVWVRDYGKENAPKTTETRITPGIH